MNIKKYCSDKDKGYYGSWPLKRRMVKGKLEIVSIKKMRKI